MEDLNSKDTIEIGLAMKIIEQELQEQMLKGFGILTVSFHIQHGRLSLIKKTNENTMKIG